MNLTTALARLLIFPGLLFAIPAAMMHMEGSSRRASSRMRSPSNPPEEGRTGSRPTAPAAALARHGKNARIGVITQGADIMATFTLKGEQVECPVLQQI